MPTYEYLCNSCGERLEVVQSFSDTALTECPSCHEAALRKVFGNVGVVFKGSGFYQNDSRKEAKSESESAPKADTKSETKSSDKTSDTSSTKTETKTANKTESKSAPKSGAKSEG